MTEDQKIEQELRDSSICPWCGGKTMTGSDYNPDTEEDQEYTYCTECDFEEGR